MVLKLIRDLRLVVNLVKIVFVPLGIEKFDSLPRVNLTNSSTKISLLFSLSLVLVSNDSFLIFLKSFFKPGYFTKISSSIRNASIILNSSLANSGSALNGKAPLITFAILVACSSPREFTCFKSFRCNSLDLGLIGSILGSYLNVPNSE